MPALMYVPGVYTNNFPLYKQAQSARQFASQNTTCTARDEDGALHSCWHLHPSSHGHVLHPHDDTHLGSRYTYIVYINACMHEIG